MKGLNKQQLQAIKHKNGPLLIIAGAGTGKTTVLTERIVNLIEKGFADPEEILALTFTEKATSEMIDRVDKALPLGLPEMWISTFHGFCDKILREKAIHIGLNPKYKLLTQAQSVKLIKDNLYKFDLDYFRPLSNPIKFVQGMVTHFSRLQDENVSPLEYLSWSEKKFKEELDQKKWKELSGAYKTYSDLKIEKGFFDFSDLITKTLELFQKRPNVLKEYQKKFKYILIDEFQDTNYSQNLLALMLSKNGNITVVGDDDQSIYRFRGASVSNIVQFRKSFPDAKVIVLNKNYRSFQEILDLSYKVIQNNNPYRLEIVEKVNKKLVSNRKGKGEIKIISTNDSLEEAEEVSKKIISLKQKGYEFKDFAVLVRANNHADIFVKTFERLGIPHQFLGPSRLFEQPEIVDLVSFLRVVHDHTDNLSLTRLLSIPDLKFSGKKISEMMSISKKTNEHLFSILEKSEEEQIIKIVSLINSHLERKYRESAGNLLFEFLQESGIYSQILSDNTENALVKANNLATFFEKIKALEKQDVQSVIDWLDLTMELKDTTPATEGDWSQENKVNILTVHSSKGLEFPVVFLVNLVSQRFPGMNRSEQIPIPEELIKEILPERDAHIEEERRLFYVGATRAKDKLFLTAAKYYGDSTREKKLSQFLVETGIEEILLESLKKHTLEIPIKIKQSEKRRQKTKVDTLSYSQIETFKICPLHYKLAYLLRVPSPTTPSLSMGNAVHDSMQDIFTNISNGSRIEEITLADILEENWNSEGFLDKKHELDAKKKCQKYLNDYFDLVYKNEVPIALEKKFLINIPIKGKNPLKITGKIDRVDKIGENTIEIIDYKTGTNIPSQREVDSNLQLSIYALAAKELFRDMEVKLSLFYFEENKKLTTKRSAADLKKATSEIYEIREEIEKSDFKCSKHFFCENCEYSLFCKQEIV